MGAVGVPWAWRVYQTRREAEIERLEKAEIKRLKRELMTLWVNQPDKIASKPTFTQDPSGAWHLAENPVHVEY